MYRAEPFWDKESLLALYLLILDHPFLESGLTNQIVDAFLLGIIRVFRQIRAHKIDEVAKNLLKQVVYKVGGGTQNDRSKQLESP